MKVTKTDFGKVGGEEVDLYSLENDKGMVASITNYGGILTSLKVPDRDGKPGEVTCGFNSLEEYFSEAYRANSPYFGCLVGRYAGRIKDGKFTVGGSDYQVETNDGSNHLHGGLNSIDKRIWSARPFEETDRVGVRLSITSPDGDNGYPGTVAIDVTISLSNDNELSLEYSARTDKATPLSLTHHAYFNLNGFQEQVKGHKAMIDADPVCCSRRDQRSGWGRIPGRGECVGLPKTSSGR